MSESIEVSEKSSSPLGKLRDIRQEEKQLQAKRAEAFREFREYLEANIGNHFMLSGSVHYGAQKIQHGDSFSWAYAPVGGILDRELEPFEPREVIIGGFDESVSRGSLQLHYPGVDNFIHLIKLENIYSLEPIESELATES